jgi:acyl-CoA thioesterase-1
MFVRFLIAVGITIASSNPVTAAEPVRIVTLGDSITHGVRPGVKADESFSAILEQNLKQKGVAAQVINLGIGGERTDQALKRLAADVIAKQPVLVTIMYGTNDSYVDSGNSMSRITADAYRKNLAEIVRRLRAAKIVPVLMTEPRWGDAGKPNGVGEHNNVRLAIYMTACREVARSQKVPLVDNFQIWNKANEDGTDVGDWTTDQCHPNPTGHRKIAAAMLPVVEKALK